MVCIYCGFATSVINSRPQRRSNQIWRRRECGHCKAIFTTLEVADLNSSLVVRHSAHQLEPFSRDKLFISLYESCKHRTDAVTVARELTTTILGQLVKKIVDGSIERETLAAIATKALERFDPTAATIYQAFHPAKRA